MTERSLRERLFPTDQTYCAEVIEVQEAQKLFLEAEQLRLAVEHFFDTLKTECYPDESWTWAMNEMTSEVNKAFCRALTELGDAARS